MPRLAQTQWDFDAPAKAAAAPAPAREVWTVADLTARLRKHIESKFATVWVSGEVSNLRAQPSGHLYFTLKDAGAQLACVLFRSQPGPDRALVRDGASLVLGGELTVYEARGQCQLRVTAVEAKGLGALQAAFERLKAKLAAEGMFAAERKRPIPRIPRRIGVATSATGAALRDFLHVAGRRYPGLEVVVAPCRVQGEGSGAEIARALALLNEWSAQREAVDVLVVTRGGGSLEDLWAFNEEIVARAIASSAIPVVSAVGHEIDFTIADFVADLRAATPSAAAELLTGGFLEAAGEARVLAGRWREAAVAGVAAAEERLGALAQRWSRSHPRRELERQGQRLDDLADSLRRLGLSQWRAMATRPDDLRRRLPTAASLGIESRMAELRRLAEKLAVLSPENTLRRGYSITRDAATGAILREPAQAPPGRRLRTRVAGGELDSESLGTP